MNRAIRAMVVAFSFAAALRTAPTRAAEPTTRECRAARDSSLEKASAHQLVSEHAQLLVCASASCPAEMQRECRRRADLVMGDIPTMIFVAKDPAGNDETAVKIVVDGDLLTDRLGGIPLAVDPGVHLFTFEVAGQRPVTKRLLIVEAQKDRQELISFGGSVDPRPAVAVSRLGSQRLVAIVTGGIGAVGLGVGAAFGALAISRRSTAQTACPAAECATPDGSAKWRDATAAGDVSTVALVVGGAGAAGAVALWFTSPSSTHGSANVGLGPGVVMVTGTW